MTALSTTSSDVDENPANVPSRLRLMGKVLGGAAKEELDGMADLLDREREAVADLRASLAAEVRALPITMGYMDGDDEERDNLNVLVMQRAVLRLIEGDTE